MDRAADIVLAHAVHSLENTATGSPWGIAAKMFGPELMRRFAPSAPLGPGQQDESGS